MKSTIAVRIVVGLALVATAGTLSIDDYFRVYHAIFWWSRPSFANSTHWLPLYSWVHGSLVGLSGDSRFVPRLANLAFGLLGCWFATRDAEDRAERLARFALAAAMPTSILLFSSTLSEALFGALVTIHVSHVARYRDRGAIADAFVASVALLFATALRYEAWVLVPISLVLVASRAPVGARRSVGIALSVLPLAFPIRWFDHVAERTGDAGSFLDAIATDPFGASRPSAFITALALPMTLFLIVVLALSANAARRTGSAPRIRLSTGYAFVFVLLACGLMAVGQLPSQIPVRLLHVPTLLAVPGFVVAVGGAGSTRRVLWTTWLGLLAGALVAVSSVDVRAPSDIASAAHLRRLLATDARATAIVEGAFPEVTQLVVDSSAPGRIFVESTGGRCRVVVAGCEFLCGRPRWLDQLRYAVVTSQDEITRLRGLGFRIASRVGTHVVLRRDGSGRSLCATHPR